MVFFMALSRLELHKVNVTAVSGSVNVCACVCFVCVYACVHFAAGCKAAPNVHLSSSQST